MNIMKYSLNSRDVEPQLRSIVVRLQYLSNMENPCEYHRTINGEIEFLQKLIEPNLYSALLEVLKNYYWMFRIVTEIIQEYIEDLPNEVLFTDPIVSYQYFLDEFDNCILATLDSYPLDYNTLINDAKDNTVCLLTAYKAGVLWCNPIFDKYDYQQQIDANKVVINPLFHPNFKSELASFCKLLDSQNM